MREIYDAIDRAGIEVALAGVIALLALVVALEYALKWLRWIRAHEYLQGYAAGYLAREDNKLPAIRIDRHSGHASLDRSVPDVFAKAFRE